MRPVGVTILAALEVISGLILLASGALFATLAGMFGMADYLGSMFGGAVSAILIGLGVASFVMAFGLLKGKPWAWTITLVLTIINLAFEIISFNIIGLIISGIILYYLFRPHVKAYFGKSTQTL